MIKKIDINNFGSYNEYSWNRVLSQDRSFKDVNIIYGRNYSGKTTLSQIFRCLEKKTLHSDYDNPDFNITLDSGSEINCSNTLSLLNMFIKYLFCAKFNIVDNFIFFSFIIKNKSTASFHLFLPIIAKTFIADNSSKEATLNHQHINVSHFIFIF